MFRKLIKTIKSMDSAYVLARESGSSLVGSIRIAVDRERRSAYLNLEGIPIKKNGTIIDIGASRGKFANDVRIRFSPKKILCIEPQPDVFNELKTRYKLNKEFHFFNYAVGSKNGSVKMQIIAHDEASSLLEIKNQGNTRFMHKNLDKVDEIEVSVKPLDEILQEENINEIDLLKIDVQGFELEVLKGASKSLPFIKVIKLEVSFYELYKGGVLFNEIHEFLTNNNFYLYNISEFQRGDNKIVLQGDAVYINNN